MSTSAKQPTLFEVFGRSQSPVVPEINEGALNQLTNILTSSGEEMGKVVLLRSPRAGYGKTLLLQSISNRLSETFRFLAVEPSGGGRIDGEVVLESVVRQLSEVLPASGGLTEFDLFARRLLALGLKPLLISGEIPSHDREGALFAIENRPIETFDFHHQQAATAHWTQANFEVLGPRLASELSELSRCSLRGCAYWVDLLFRYATTPPEKVERTRLLSDAIFGDLQNQSGSGAEDRLQSLLALMSLIEPVVLVFDETEGLSNQPEAGLKVAAFVVQLRQACPALTVILAVNEDVWETGLSPLMPGGLSDRLTEYEVELDKLSRTDAESLLSSRFGKDAEVIAGRMKWPEPLSARAVLREGAHGARALDSEGALELSSQTLVEEIAGVTTPPPLEGLETEPAGESFEEKAERILEPSSSFEPEEAVGFEAAPTPEPMTPEPVTAPVVEKEPAPSAEQDPFAEPEVEAIPEPITEPVTPEPESEPASSSPFEIVPEPATEPTPPPIEPIEEPAPPSSPFSTVEPQAEEAAAGEWSAQSAVDHFAASQEAPAPAAAPPEIPKEPETAVSAVGSAFDAAPPVQQAPAQPEPTVQAEPEPSPFQILQEEKDRLESEAREKEAQLAREVELAREAKAKAEAAAAAQTSPFAVSEPVAEPPQPVTQQVAPAAAPQPVATPPTERVQVAATAPVSAPQPVTAPVVERAPAPAAQPAQPATAPVAEKAPATPAPEPEASKAETSPFAASSAPATSPFASAPATPENATSGQDAEDVEALLSQFKKKFGQSGS